MRFWGHLGLAVAAALCFTSAQAYDLEDGRTAMSFKLGVEHNYPPYQFRNENNELVGFEIDLMDAIAEEMEVSFTYEEGVFDLIYSRTQGGDLDGLLGGNCITADRKQSFLLSDTYLHSGQCIAVSEFYGAETADNVDTMKRRKTCVESGTMGHRYTRTLHFTDVEVLDTIPHMVEQFNAGRCVFMIADCMIFDFYMKSGYIKDAELRDDPVISTQIVVLVNRKSPQLLEVVNEGLKRLRENGRYEKIYKKWFYNRTVGRPLQEQFDVDNY